MNTLWTKNFTIITLGTVISAIGATAMNLVLSFVVFDQTKSTFLSGAFGAISIIPSLILPLISSVWLDRFPRKPVIVKIDFLNGCLYFLFGLFSLVNGFQYMTYLLFSFILTATSSIYQIAYQSLYPHLIPSGFAQKGYTISSMIYPTVTIIVSPIASFLYTKTGIIPIFFIYSLLLWTASAFEHFITIKETYSTQKINLHKYMQDLKDGFFYLKENKGLKAIYMTLPIGQGYSEGSQPLLVAYFSSSPHLGITLYSLFTIFEFIGRTIGGVFQYRVHIPANKRFSLCFAVYVFYALMDAILLWISYPWMLINRSLCGFCGINSATLRESSVQNYIPDNKRAKLNAFMNIIYALSSMIFRFVFGILGEWISIPILLTSGALLEIFVYYGILYRHKKTVMTIYNQEY